MDKILEMSWFSFILMWAAVFITDFILAGVAFNGLQDYHKEQHRNLDSDKECYSGVEDFMTAILFAFETAQTIGYGSRYPEKSDIHYPWADRRSGNGPLQRHQVGHTRGHFRACRTVPGG